MGEDDRWPPPGAPIRNVDLFDLDDGHSINVAHLRSAVQGGELGVVRLVTRALRGGVGSGE